MSPRKDIKPALAKIKRSKTGRHSKDKGSSFERLTGKMLSQWITGGEREDLFSRNVLSGGRFTNSLRNKTSLGVPGDLMAAHPLAFNFLSHFLVECKHYKDLGIHLYLVDQKEKSFLAQVIKHTAAQAESAGLTWMLIAKQNMIPTLIFLPRAAYEAACILLGGSYRMHSLHNGSIGVMRFEDFLVGIDATEYLITLANRQEIAK
jgi:hypothetical protein